jgi:ubiquitin-large subunit ribosomal protein L40e
LRRSVLHAARALRCALLRRMAWGAHLCSWDQQPQAQAPGFREGFASDATRARPPPPARAHPQVGGVVPHSQRTAGDSEELKNARRLTSMTAMQALGFQPDLGLWASPGFEPRAVPLEGVHGMGSVFVDARTVAGDIKGMLAGLGAPCASVEVKRSRRDAIVGARMTLFQIFVKTLTGRTITIALAGGGAATVRELKRAVEEHEGLPAGEQRLIYAGQQLEDCKPVSEYGMGPCSTVHCVLRLLGC